MKRLLLLLFGLMVSLNVGAQADEKKVGPLIVWEKPTHDFGDIFQGDRVEHTYKFTNAGTSPLIITNVQVTCGCTTPKGWPRDPIGPGDKGEIIVAFSSSGKFGRQNKVVTVISNAVNGSNQITFTTNVLEKKDPN